MASTTAGGSTGADPKNVRPYPELSFVAVALGSIQGMIMTAAFVYIALKLGFGLGGSTVAAIMGFVVLRGALGRRSIVENNINQTVASGINTASAGVVFTLPALFLLSVDNPGLLGPPDPATVAALISEGLTEAEAIAQARPGFPFGPLIFSAIAGSLMGIVLIIPLRKQMIEFERLKFPSGVAVATLLRSPGEGLTQGLLLLGGSVLASALTITVNLHYLPEEWDIGAYADVPPWLPIALYISAANLGAGLLSGRGGLAFAVGGVLAWWVISPIAIMSGWVPFNPGLPEADVAMWQTGELYSQMLRPLGIGMLIGGALAGVVAALPAVAGAMKSLQAAAAMARERGASPEELSPKVVYFGAVGAFFLLLIASSMATDLSFMNNLLIAIVGSLWLALAGIIVAQATGATDISPLSGLSLIAVTLMYFLSGGNITASILIGMTVCIAINQCADMMADLKTGHLVGAIPREQQLAQLFMCWIGPLIAIGVLYLLWEAPSSFGPESAGCTDPSLTCLSAPQAGALQGMIEALATGDSAVDKYISGAAIGGTLSIFPIGGLGVLVGLAMYLPFSITLAYGIGCLIAMALEAQLGAEFIGKRLVPAAAGLIVGEALTQLVFSAIGIFGGG